MWNASRLGWVASMWNAPRFGWVASTWIARKLAQGRTVIANRMFLSAFEARSEIHVTCSKARYSSQMLIANGT
jgi:hypothetical protein